MTEYFGRPAWRVGRRTVVLMDSGAVIIATNNEDGYTEQFTLATGLPGLRGLIEVLQEVAEKIESKRMVNGGGNDLG